MKKELFILTLIVALLFVTACRKEKTELLSVTGYWTGGVSGNDMTVLNRENGTTRLYIYPVNISGRDTATDAYKYDGSWQLRGSLYSAEYKLPGNASYIFKATVNTPVISITGILNTVSSNSSASAVFYMLK